LLSQCLVSALTECDIRHPIHTVQHQHTCSSSSSSRHAMLVACLLCSTWDTAYWQTRGTCKGWYPRGLRNWNTILPMIQACNHWLATGIRNSAVSLRQPCLAHLCLQSMSCRTSHAQSCPPRVNSQSYAAPAAGMVSTAAWYPAAANTRDLIRCMHDAPINTMVRSEPPSNQALHSISHSTAVPPELHHTHTSTHLYDLWAAFCSTVGALHGVQHKCAPPHPTSSLPSCVCGEPVVGEACVRGAVCQAVLEEADLHTRNICQLPVQLRELCTHLHTPARCM
jgi:hypothetical protein